MSMKRILFLLVFLCTATALFAQSDMLTKEERFRQRFPYRYELRIGYGGSPEYDLDNFMYSGCYRNDLPENFASLANLYRVQTGAEYVTGVFSADFSIHFRRWFTLAFNMGVNGMWGSDYDPITEVYSARRGVSFNIMPVARFNWFTFSAVRMYSAAGLGLYTGFYNGKTEVTPAAMFVPAGITVGKKFFFFAESCVSTASMGGNVGVGYRF